MAKALLVWSIDRSHTHTHTHTRYTHTHTHTHTYTRVRWCSSACAVLQQAWHSRNRETDFGHRWCFHKINQTAFDSVLCGVTPTSLVLLYCDEQSINVIQRAPGQDGIKLNVNKMWSVYFIDLFVCLIVYVFILCLFIYLFIHLHFYLFIYWR